MVDSNRIRCLILACGNTLRGDDGVGPWLAEWARERFRGDEGVHVIARLQWTPELSEEIAAAESVVFIDASVQVSPGEIRVAPVASAQDAGEVATHYNDAAHLLQLCSYLYGVAPRSSLLLTIGVGSTELGEGFSDAVEAALPEAHRVLEELVIDTRI